jgi:hypothetical protein
MENILETIKQMQVKCDRADSVAKAYEELPGKLRAISDQLEKMANELVPRVKSRGGQHTAKGAAKEIINEVYDRMKSGLHVTTALIEKTYPQLEQPTVKYVVLSLKRLPHVQLVKDGRNIRLFFQ